MFLNFKNTYKNIFQLAFTVISHIFLQWKMPTIYIVFIKKKSNLLLTQAVSPLEYVSFDIFFCNDADNIERVYISNRDKSRNEKKKYAFIFDHSMRSSFTFFHQIKRDSISCSSTNSIIFIIFFLSYLSLFKRWFTKLFLLTKNFPLIKFE